MDQTWIQNMQILKERLNTEISDLRVDLNRLTQDGSGLLYDMKNIVGADSEMGANISSIGGVIMEAKQTLFVSLHNINSLIAEKISDAQKYNEEAIANQQKVAAGVSSITWAK